MTLFLGKRKVDLHFLGRAHTAGDIVIHIPDSNALFTGDIVEYKSACYCGDAHLKDWPKTLKKIAKFNPEAIVPPIVASSPNAGGSNGSIWPDAESAS